MVNMLVPKVDIKEFEKLGFKQCRKNTKNSNCYYLCVARGCKLIFVSPIGFDIQDWKRDDPRIHKKPNCKFRDNRTAEEILYDLIKADMFKKVD